MKLNKTSWIFAGAALVFFAGVWAATGGDLRPLASEQCVAQCDVVSDQCMARAGNDERKAKACDDQYAECLKKCR